MHNDVVEEILKKYDNIIEELFSESDIDVKTELKKYESDFNLINQWREEIASDKQSVYVIGKTSTGKSEFHNYLVDIESENKLFKTATGVETGVLQTLQHVDSGQEPNVRLTIKDINNFNKLQISEQLSYSETTEICRMPLITNKQVAYLRDFIMAKSRNKNDYNPIKALSRIDIFYPMKYFRNFIFVDTPGLGSHNSATDHIVREYIKGKSHIFWFLNASTQTLSDSISLLEKEKILLCDAKIRKRIIFLANMFDLLNIEDDDDCEKTPAEKRKWKKNQITEILNDALKTIINKNNVNANPIFTSFKYIDKKLGESTTQSEMKDLENMLLSNRYDCNFDNIESLVNLLRKILDKINKNIVAKKKEKINNDVEKLNDYRNEVETEIKKTNTKKELIDKANEKSKKILYDFDIIKRIEKIKNRKYYKEIEQKVEKRLTNIHKDRYIDLLKACFSNITISNKSREKIENIKKITISKFKTREPWFLKTLIDSELKQKRNNLLKLIEQKEHCFDEISRLLCKDIEEHIKEKSRELKSIKENIENKNQEREGVEADDDTIKHITSILNNIYELLRKDVEKRISEWNMPQDKNSQYHILENFLQLNSTLREHDVLINRKGE